jgi:Tfp pilus assembly protein PilE
MSPILVVAIIVGIAIIIAVIAYAPYRAGFRVDKIKAKLPMLEMEASRTTDKTKTDAKNATPKIHQEAIEGGAISKSGITAPADSDAEIDQKAKGEKSKIDDSPIRLT